MIDPDLGLELFSANDINDRGQILATAVIDGEGHAVLLTPIAGVPYGGSTAMLFVCALASLMVLRQCVASNTATTFDVF